MTATQQPWDGSGDSWEDDHTQKKRKEKKKEPTGRVATWGCGRRRGMRVAAAQACLPGPPTWSLVTAERCLSRAGQTLTL